MTHQEIDGLARAGETIRRATAILRLSLVCVVLALFGIAFVHWSCSGQQAARVVSGGSDAAELICALVLEPSGVEREICDTGAKLAELLGVLLVAEDARQPAAPTVSALPSAEPVASTRSPFAKPPSESRGNPRVRLLRLYAKPHTSADGGPDAALGTHASDSGEEGSPGIPPG